MCQPLPRWKKRKKKKRRKNTEWKTPPDPYGNNKENNKERLISTKEIGDRGGGAQVLVDPFFFVFSGSAYLASEITVGPLISDLNPLDLMEAIVRYL